MQCLTIFNKWTDLVNAKGPVCLQLPLPKLLHRPPYSVVIGAMKLLQPHHAEVRHAVSVSGKARRHRVIMPCADFATGSVSVAGRACRRPPQYKRMPGSAHKTPHKQHLKIYSQHCSSRCTCCRPRPRTSLPLPCTCRLHNFARHTVYLCSASGRILCYVFVH